MNSHLVLNALFQPSKFNNTNEVRALDKSRIIWRGTILTQNFLKLKHPHLNDTKKKQIESTNVNVTKVIYHVIWIYNNFFYIKNKNFTKHAATHVSIISDTFDCGFEWKIKTGKTNQTHSGHDGAWREASNLKYDKQSTARNGPRTALQYPWFVAESCARPTTVQIHWTLNVLYKVRKKLQFLFCRMQGFQFYF